MVLRRYPDGVGGKAFFQKEAPSFLPDWIGTATVESEERGGEMQYILANNRAALLYLTNLGCIDHNPWSSRAESQDRPDYVFFDLDPTPGTPFSDVLHIARRDLQDAEVDPHAVFPEDVGRIWISYLYSAGAAVQLRTDADVRGGRGPAGRSGKSETHDV